MNYSKFSGALALCAVLTLAALSSAPAMEDTAFKCTQTNASLGVTNYTSSFDLGVASPSSVWRQAYVKVAVPAGAKMTNDAETFYYTPQHSTDNSTFVFTTPLIQCKLVGVASTGTAATNYYVPIPKTVFRYIRFQHSSPTNSGANETVTNSYSLVIP